MADYHVKEGLPLAVWYLQYQEGHSAGDREPVLAVIEKYGAYAKDVIPDLEKCYSAWQAQKTRKADMAKLRETINKIKALPDDKKFELVSIADRIKDLPNPFLTAVSAEDKAMSSPGK
jgi:aminopeptidase C